MPDRLFSGLAGKQAAVTLLIALAFGILGSLFELYSDWQTWRQQTVEGVRRMLLIAQPSAAEAAYLLNEQLARRVVTGLAHDVAVRSIRLHDERGSLLASHEAATPRNYYALASRLFGDVTEHHVTLMHNDRRVGRLDLALSPEVLAADFYRQIVLLATLALLRALAICAVVVLAFHYMIIRPLQRLAQQVSAIDPVRPAAGLLPAVPGHDGDEIGRLIERINHLLQAFQQGLDERDRAEAGLSELARELEERVVQRTEALATAKHEIEALNRRLAAENLRMGAELDVSRKLQRMTLPTPEELSNISGLDIATFMESANEVGGDYYDILRDETRDGHLRIGIGDVTGHGLESGVVMLMTQSAVRTLTTGAKGDLSRALEVLNRTIYDNVRRMGSDRNLTLALIDYQPTANGGKLRIAGQHESVIVVRHDGTLELIDTTLLGMPLGLLDSVDQFLGEVDVLLAVGDVVVLYTDGIIEAANDAQELYGLERLCRIVVAHHREAAGAIERAVIDDVRRHIGAQTLYDDLTLIVLKQKEPVRCAS